MIKIAKLDPQPKHIFSSGYQGYEFGVTEGIEKPDDFFGGTCLHEGPFIPCPIEVNMEEWATREVDFIKIDGEWWWIRREALDEASKGAKQ
jgi:hypothetical protein